MKFQYLLVQDLCKLKVKKGFTLIEVICSITVFSILFITATSIKLNSIALKKYNNEINKDISFIEGFKNLVIYNTKYSDIVKLCNDNSCNVFYIEKNKIDISEIKNNSFEQIVTSSYTNEKPYVELTINRGDVLKLHIKMDTKILNKDQIFEYDFYKGNY